eukprot:TRINITY_DN19933_c0_g2_i1.p1 TRINITY_DN19933_c0_g2~~TRINITY_DN19933_c0_g2_i1.p1  ORF type:complete len:199 (-),score=12.54 TRINITY_DN19933_c0_g2_i1:167-763(-)
MSFERFREGVRNLAYRCFVCRTGRSRRVTNDPESSKSDSSDARQRDATPGLLEIVPSGEGADTTPSSGGRQSTFRGAGERTFRGGDSEEVESKPPDTRSYKSARHAVATAMGLGMQDASPVQLQPADSPHEKAPDSSSEGRAGHNQHRSIDPLPEYDIDERSLGVISWDGFSYTRVHPQYYNTSRGRSGNRIGLCEAF